MDFPMFKKWLPENALPTAVANPLMEPGAAERGELGTVSDPRGPAKKRSLKPKDGPFREVWEKIEKGAATLSAADLRVLFLKELRWVSPSKAGELWIEFHEALCSDVADEAAGVLALDQLLQPD